MTEMSTGALHQPETSTPTMMEQPEQAQEREQQALPGRENECNSVSSQGKVDSAG